MHRERIEAHLASGGEGRWVVIVDQPLSFDLVRSTNVERLLGERAATEGTYTRVRLSIAAVTVVSGSIETQALGPSAPVVVTRPFRVHAGQTTSVFLDFDGARSLVAKTGGGYSFEPRLHISVSDPGPRSSSSPAVLRPAIAFS